MELLSGNPAQAIRDALSPTCQVCPRIHQYTEAMAYWVSEGRVTAQDASRLILEKVGCSIIAEAAG